MELKQLKVTIPAELHRRLKIFSVTHDVEMTEIVVKLLEEFLSKEEKKAKK